MNKEERKDFIIESITEAKDGIKQSNVKLNDLKNKIQKIEEAIDIFESEDIPVPESMYGIRDRYKSEYENEKILNEQLVRVTDKLANQIEWPK